MTDRRFWTVKQLEATLEGSELPLKQSQIRSAFTSGRLIKQAEWTSKSKYKIVVRYKDLHLTDMGSKIKKIIDAKRERRDLRTKLKGFDVKSRDVAYEVAEFNDHSDDTYETELSTFRVECESYGGGKDERGEYNTTRIVEVRRVEEIERDDLNQFFAPRNAHISIRVYANGIDHIADKPLYVRTVHTAWFSPICNIPTGLQGYSSVPQCDCEEKVEDQKWKDYREYMVEIRGAFYTAKRTAQDTIFGLHAAEEAKQEEITFVGVN